MAKERELNFVIVLLSPPLFVVAKKGEEREDAMDLLLLFSDIHSDPLGYDFLRFERKEHGVNF